jgi:Tol biopolymer transport system component
MRSEEEMGSRRRSRRVVGSFAAVAAIGATAHAQSIVRVDVANDGSETTGMATYVDVSDDGTKVVFSTNADGLDPNDVNGEGDVLLRDLVAGTTTLVSVRSNEKQGNGQSWYQRISGDGRFVAFSSDASNLVGSDDNGQSDVFVRDLSAGTTSRVSVSSDGTEANGSSGVAAISGDGNRILFFSDATNLVPDDHNGRTDLFLRDVAAGTTIRVNTALDGTEADGNLTSGDMSRDGKIVMFTTYATNLIPDDTNGAADVYVRDLSAGTIVRASVDAEGSEIPYGVGNYKVEGAGNVLASDGRFVAFTTRQDDLVERDDNATYDVFLRDLVAGTTTIQSLDSDGSVSAAYSLKIDIGTFATGVSDGGRFVLMEGSALTLAPHQESNTWVGDVYMRDRDLAMTTRQSNDPNGYAGNDVSNRSRMTADGACVAFVSLANGLIDGHPTSGRCAFLLRRPLRAATSESYGSGLGGTLGTPALSAATPPLLNRSCDVELTSSSEQWTVGLLFLGTAPAQIPTRLGGELLVATQWTQFVVVSPFGTSLVARLPHDERLAEFDLYLQALELDAGAIHGVSFTPGLALHPGF